MPSPARRRRRAAGPLARAAVAALATLAVVGGCRSAGPAVADAPRDLPAARPTLDAPRDAVRRVAHWEDEGPAGGELPELTPDPAPLAATGGLSERDGSGAIDAF